MKPTKAQQRWLDYMREHGVEMRHIAYSNHVNPKIRGGYKIGSNTIPDKTGLALRDHLEYVGSDVQAMGYIRVRTWRLKSEA